jgi:hypothetical protein
VSRTATSKCGNVSHGFFVPHTDSLLGFILECEDGGVYYSETAFVPYATERRYILDDGIPFTASFMLVYLLAYSCNLNFEDICPSETSVDFHRTTSPYILEERTLLTAYFVLVSCLTCYLTLKVEAIFSFETSVSPNYTVICPIKYNCS